MTQQRETNIPNDGELSIGITKEATRGLLDMLKSMEELQQQFNDELVGNMRRRMTRNYNALVKEIEEKEKNDEARHSEVAKKWIRENLEEAQQLIDNIVGIKGITEDPLRAAAEAGIVSIEIEDVLTPQEPSSTQQPSPPSRPLPRVSISSSIVPSNAELYGY
jgi:hypothetical protein